MSMCVTVEIVFEIKTERNQKVAASILLPLVVDISKLLFSQTNTSDDALDSLHCITMY